ncbi:MAG TPA: hypothetical protein VLK65_10455 [Vicinamibacteria bacterium]|nr:hypothetical protein [Vicinamibacteria bacterium]
MFPERFTKGAAAGMASATVFLGALTASFLGTGLPVPLELLGGAILTTACVFVGIVVARFSIRLLARFPEELLLTGIACIATLVALHELRFRWPVDLFYPAAIVFVVSIGVLFGAVKSRRFYRIAALALVVNVAGALWLASAGHDPFPVKPEANGGVAPDSLENPAAPGPYRFQALTYGSGTDRRRAEFCEGVAWKSRTVDASKLLPDWKGFKARARRWYWGFDLDEAPINGRVWLPEGRGPFPLVLVVHGNHRMEEHSDPGYAYLGELLASRGLLTVSVAENFINGTWSGDFRGKEMALRAWLLLEHLKQWREWNEEAGHRMEGKADLSNVALIGHSRGGEAIAIATAFNGLAHHPDDATIRFDYRFGIRALVAIAQTDVRYSRRIELEDVSFLALQGSYDNDEASFFGMRQFRRIDLKGSPDHFKASLYLHGANHGQFNTVWGRTDAGPPNSWFSISNPSFPARSSGAWRKSPSPLSWQRHFRENVLTSRSFGAQSNRDGFPRAPTSIVSRTRLTRSLPISKRTST